MKRRASAPTLSLEVSFNGVDPPLELFDDLRMIGWRPPAVPPPPKHAIDWARADPATGKAFTILAFEVAGAVVEPPAGSGPRGQWTAADRAALVIPLRGVLRRHGADGDPSFREHVDDAVEAEVAGFAMTAIAPAPPPPATPRPAPSAPATSGAPETPVEPFLFVTVAVTPASAPAAGRALAGLPVAPRLVEVSRTREERFRGSAHQVTTIGHELHVVVPTALGPAVMEAWRQAGLRPVPEPASAADHEAFLRALAADADPPSDDQAGRERGTLPCIGVVADQRRSPLIQEAIDELDLDDVRVTPTTRTSVTTFRGSATQTEVPAMLVEVWVEPARAETAARRLATAAGLDRDDPLVTVDWP